MIRSLKIIFFIFLLNTFSHAQETFPINGVQESFKPVYAFINANIIISSEKEIKNGTLLIQDNLIIGVDSNLSIPENAITYDLKGDYIYPSFIDLYSRYGLKKPSKKSSGFGPQYESEKNGPYSWNEAIHPEIHASHEFSHDNKNRKKYHEMGFGSVATHIQDGIFRGSGCLAILSKNNENQDLVLDKAATFYSFKKGISNQRYPTSLMGSIALIKQTLLDAEWYDNIQNQTNISLKEYNLNKELPKIFEVKSHLDYARLFKISDEFEIDFIVKGTGKEFLRIDEIKATEFPIITPINFPEDYDVSVPEEAMNINLQDLKNWETAPFNLKILKENGITFAITATDSKDKKSFFKNLRLAIKSGLSEKDALNALTTIPAKLIGAENILGTLEKGKIANFLICSSNIFLNGTIHENWTAGSRNIITKKIETDVRGYYSFNSVEYKNISVKVTGDKNQPKILIEAIDSTILKSKLEENKLTFYSENSSFRASGVISLNEINGKYQDSSGTFYDYKMIRDSLFIEKENEIKKLDTQKTPSIWSPNKSNGLQKELKAKTIIFKNATLWTNEDLGIINSGDIAISNGKIVAIGETLDTTQIPNHEDLDIHIFDIKGKHLTTGIIDEHSHIAISNGVNESSQSVTAEVSIADVINPEDHNIFRQIASGVTCSQLLHGSANPIGGQSALIKLRWGKSAEEMKIKNTDGFIKFALGENVKQSNWGNFNTTRFPQTRMGVEQVFYDAFYRAKEYKKNWKTYNSLNSRQKRETNPPREDLELNTLVEILDGKRHITCHSYVESEINMLMHVADSMGFKINTFTHILEGYKVTEKLKNHNAGASTFADWWAYKFEVNDAIPYNASILNNAGVVTAINSDDAEMGRRLNQEAAKAVKYGGTSEEDAWKMVTLNPAKLLRLDNKIGSLKVGKDADIVIWSGNPLSVYSKAEQTYIDGICYFNNKEYLLNQERDLKEKMRIINKLSRSKSKNKIKHNPKKDKLYHCDTIEHEHEHDHDH